MTCHSLQWRAARSCRPRIANEHQEARIVVQRICQQDVTVILFENDAFSQQPADRARLGGGEGLFANLIDGAENK